MPSADKSVAAATWEEFCESLKGAAAVLRREETPDDPLQLAEGVRHLSRALRMGLEAGFEHADPAHPYLYEAKDEATLSGGVCPDMTYHEAIIDAAHRYRIVGDRGTAPLVEISVYEGKPGLHPSARLVASITEEQISVDAHNQIEVHIGGSAASAGSLPCPPGLGMVMVRQVAHDWRDHRAAQLRIQCLGSPEPRAPLSLDDVRDGFVTASRYALALPSLWIEQAVDPATTALANQIVHVPFDDRSRLNLGAAQLHSIGSYRLAPGEGLELRVVPPRCAYWSVFLANYWFEPYQYRYRAGRSHLNDQAVSPEADGSVRVVVAPTDPGLPNWIATAGHHAGLILFFWLRVSASQAPIECRVINLPHR